MAVASDRAEFARLHDAERGAARAIDELGGQKIATRSEEHDGTATQAGIFGAEVYCAAASLTAAGNSCHGFSKVKVRTSLGENFHIGSVYGAAGGDRHDHGLRLGVPDSNGS